MTQRQKAPLDDWETKFSSSAPPSSKDNALPFSTNMRLGFSEGTHRRRRCLIMSAIELVNDGRFVLAVGTCKDRLFYKRRTVRGFTLIKVRPYPAKMTTGTYQRSPHLIYGIRNSYNPPGAPNQDTVPYSPTRVYP